MRSAYETRGPVYGESLSKRGFKLNKGKQREFLQPDGTKATKSPYFLGMWDPMQCLVKRKPVDVLTNVWSWEPGHILFLRTFTEEMNKHAPVDIQSDGSVGRSGVHSDFNRCCTVAGYYMNPLAYVVNDNKALREERGLPNGWKSERHREIYRAFWRHIYGTWKVSAPKIAEDSKSGFPFFEYTAAEKMKRIYPLLENDAKGALRVLVQLHKGDHVSPRKDWGFILGYILGTRGQVDYIGKEREVATIEYARSGGRKGKRIIADKTVVLPNGKRYDGMSAMRARIVQAMSNTSNSILQIIANGHLQWMFSSLASMTHHTHMDKLCDEVNAKHGTAAHDMYAGDVSEFDSTGPDFFREENLDVMGEFYAEEIVTFTRKCATAPYYAPPVALGGDAAWFGNPDDPDTFTINAGIRSGIAVVSLWGKGDKIAEELMLVDDYYHDVLENFDRYLKNEMLVTIKNAGDDNQTYGPVAFIKWLEEAREKRDRNGQAVYGYFKIEAEKGKGFIGNVFHRDLTTFKWKWFRKIHSAFEKFWCPEHGFTHKFRQYAAAGVYARKEIYRSCPTSSLYNEVETYAWEKSGQKAVHGNIMSIVDASARKMGNPMEYAETAADLAVLNDREKIHYAFQDGEVSERIIDLFVKRLDLDACVNFMKHVFDGEFFDPIIIVKPTTL